MRELGLKATSAGAIRVVRRRATELGLDTSHFRGQRRWSDGQLTSAIVGAATWDEVFARLGLAGDSGSYRTFIKGHATRLGLDYRHLDPKPPEQPDPSPLQPDLRHLREAAPSIASAWFTLCGCPVSFPIEPAVFDVLVSMPDGISRVQVKTTTCRSRNGWLARIGRRPYSERNLAPLAPYDPDEIDLFFIVDGDLNMYLIPSPVIAGRTSVLLRAYEDYVVGNVKEMLGGGGTVRVA